MIVILKKNVKQKDIDKVIEIIEHAGLKAHISKGKERTVVGAIGDERVLHKDMLNSLSCVDKVIEILKPYKLASREFHPADTTITVKGVAIGGKCLQVMAGPCAIEDENQMMETAKAIKNAGGRILRGGAFKPRTSPYSFQGLGEKGLKMLEKAGKRYGLVTITEVMDTRHVALVAKYADILQIGARNMQNFNLLKEVGKINKPVMLKNGLSATVKELLMSAEYIMSEGNKQVILCLRGIRTFETATRNTLDMAMIAYLKGVCHLPVIVDPSHATGKYALINPLAKAAIVAGADGLMIEAHPNPTKSVSDADQTISLNKFKTLMKELKPIAKVSKKKL